MVRTTRGERTTAEILHAARDLLLEVGIDKLTLREVARRADLAPSAVYNHFRDLDALVTALAIEAVTQLATVLGAVPAGPAPSRLKALGRAYARFAAEHPREYAVIFDCLTTPPHPWDDYVQVANPFTLIVQTCEQGLAEKTLRDPSGLGASAMAFALWALVDGQAHLRLKHLAAVSGPFDAMTEAAIDAVVDGFSAGSCDDGARGSAGLDERSLA